MGTLGRRAGTGDSLTLLLRGMTQEERVWALWFVARKLGPTLKKKLRAIVLAREERRMRKRKTRARRGKRLLA